MESLQKTRRIRLSLMSRPTSTWLLNKDDKKVRKIFFVFLTCSTEVHSQLQIYGIKIR